MSRSTASMTARRSTCAPISRRRAARTTVNLASFAAAPRKIPVKLSAPTTISIENGTVSLQKLTIGASGGTIAVTGSAGEKLDLTVTLNALPASLANTFVPSLGADGAISGTVGVKGTSAAPVVAYDLRWANAAVAQAKIRRRRRPRHYGQGPVCQQHA